MRMFSVCWMCVFLKCSRVSILRFTRILCKFEAMINDIMSVETVPCIWQVLVNAQDSVSSTKGILNFFKIIEILKLLLQYPFMNFCLHNSLFHVLSLSSVTSTQQKRCFESVAPVQFSYMALFLTLEWIITESTQNTGCKNPCLATGKIHLMQLFIVWLEIQNEENVRDLGGLVG